jgi:hypothetical protein
MNIKKNLIYNYMKTQHKFFCERCQYGTNIRQNFNNHELSKKHREINENKVKIYVCECKKPYKSYMGYWTHKKTCPSISSTDEINSIPENEMVPSSSIANQDNLLLLKMIEKQEKMENLIVELSKNQKPSTINNNTNSNNTINNVTILNILNTNYKDVIDLEKFIMSIEPTSAELEQIKDLNSCINFYQNLITDRLKSFKLTERPFHCIIDEDHNAETFLKQKEWVKEYFEGFKNYMPIMTEILLLYNEKFKKDIDSYIIPESEREKIKRTLNDIPRKETTLTEIKEKICYSMDTNIFELNHKLLENRE